MSDPYPKIQSIYKRDTNGTFLIGDWSTDEIYELKDVRWRWTEKVDGTNIRLTYSPWVIGYRGREHTFVQGRTDRAQIPPQLLDQCVILLQDAPLEEAFPDLGVESVTFYGEGYGARIQKGGGNYIPDGVGFILFDIKIGDLWLKRGDIVDIAKKLGWDVVPHLFIGTINDAEDCIRSGFASRWKNVPEPEGLVGVPCCDVLDRRGNRIMTKVKFKDFRKAHLIL